VAQSNGWAIWWNIGESCQVCQWSTKMGCNIVRVLKWPTTMCGILGAILVNLVG
jgi:hypothetical protein